MSRHKHKNPRVKVYFRHKGHLFKLFEAINFGTKSEPQLKIKGLTETYMQIRDDQRRFDGNIHVGQYIRFVDGNYVEFTYHKDGSILAETILPQGKKEYHNPYGKDERWTPMADISTFQPVMVLQILSLTTYREAFIEEKYGLKIVITKSATGAYETSATVDEIEAFRERFHLNPHEALYSLLKLKIEAEQSSLPMQIDEGMVITGYTLIDDNIMVVVEIDESVYSMSDFIDNYKLMKSSVIEELLTDPEGKVMLDLCKVSHSGLVYRMIGNFTQKSLDIVINQEEIRQFDPMPSNVTIR